MQHTPSACACLLSALLLAAASRDGDDPWCVPTPIAVATMPRGSLDLTEETIKEFREAFALFVRWEGIDGARVGLGGGGAGG